MPEILGDAPCPLCGEAAEVKENRSGKSYLSCEWCSTQIQTRTKHGDIYIRRLIQTPAQNEVADHGEHSEPGQEHSEETAGRAGGDGTGADEQPARRSSRRRFGRI